MYLGKAVSDDYLQGLIVAYRDAYEAVTGNAEDADQPILDRLTAEKVVTKNGAADLGEKDAKAATPAG
jgi:hypothetical protein